MRVTVILILAALCLTSCARRHVTTEEKSGFDRDGSLQMGTSATLHFGDEEATLDYAADLMRKGEFDRAAEAYESVRAAKSAKAEYREQALLGLGQVYSNPLNRRKDYARALGFLEQLLAEFPETTLRSRVEQKARDVRQLMDGQR